MPPVVVPKIKGKHGFAPPDREIAVSVTHWLHEKHSWLAEGRFTVEVECRRIPASRYFQGVRAYCMPFPGVPSVELRVRPLSGDPYQYQCFLLCPEVEIAREILSIERPEASSWIVQHSEDLIRRSQETTAVSMRKSAKAEEKRNREVLAKKRLSVQLTQKVERRALCYGMTNYLAKIREGPGFFTYESILQVITRRMQGGIVDLELAELVTHDLVSAGFLEPRTATSFQPTFLLLEYAEDLHQETHQRLLDQAKQKLASLEQRQKQRLVEQAAAEQKVTAIGKDIIQLDQEIRETCTEVAERENSSFSLINQDES